MNNIIADEVFVLRKRLNRVNSEIEEIERDFEIKYPNSVVIINSKLDDLYKKKKSFKYNFGRNQKNVWL